MADIPQRGTSNLVHWTEPESRVEPHKLGMVEISVINGKEFSFVAATVIPMPNCDSPDEQSDAKYGFVHSDGFPAQPDRIQMENFARKPNPNDALGLAQILLGGKAPGGDPEEGAQRLESEVQILCPGCVNDVVHCG